ncbi:MAG: glycosyltransferase family 1 protein, partial [Clostridia bacterium]|nr:glycosyltransferase family 1 protein [Clostridia bacterium]
FAAMIADYFGSGTPILAVSMQEGAIIHILRGSNSLVLSYSAEEIKNYLYLILEQGYTLVPNKDFIAAFESKRAAAEFDKCIPELLK